jgi:hypothetical protein
VKAQETVLGLSVLVYKGKDDSGKLRVLRIEDAVRSEMNDLVLGQLAADCQSPAGLEPKRGHALPPGYQIQDVFGLLATGEQARNVFTFPEPHVFQSAGKVVRPRKGGKHHGNRYARLLRTTSQSRDPRVLTIENRVGENRYASGWFGARMIPRSQSYQDGCGGEPNDLVLGDEGKRICAIRRSRDRQGGKREVVKRPVADDDEPFRSQLPRDRPEQRSA